MSLHLNLSTGKFLNSSTLFKLSDALLLDVSSGEIVMSNLLVPRAGVDLFKLASLDLNFAQRKSLTDSVSNNNLITFSRASSGTYVGSDGLIKTTPVNYLRESIGLVTGWLNSPANFIRTANYATAPDGTQTATRLQTQSGLVDPGNSAYTTRNYRAASIDYGVGTQVTVSVYVKPITTTSTYPIVPPDGAPVQERDLFFWLQAEGGIGSFWFNLNTKQTKAGSTAVDVGNGWWRFSATGTTTSSDGQNMHFVLLSNRSNSSSFDPYPDGNEEVYVWGIQSEIGPSATTYIPTTTTISGAPRFDHDPSNGESLGLLIEESRANLLTYSEDFAGTGWNLSNAAITPNSSTAPNGTLSATLLYPSSSGSSSINRTIGNVASMTASNAIFAKAAGKSWLRLVAPQGNVSAWFNLSSGVVGTTQAGVTASIADAGNGWYRCSVTQTATFQYFQVSSVDGDNITTVTASGTDGILIFGAQLEVGSFPTSYIPTSGSTVTRSPDIASIEGNKFAKTNLLSYSERFDQSAWTKSSTSITPNDTAAPNGTTTADLVSSTAGTSFQYIQRATNYTGEHTFAVYLKDAGARYAQISLTNHATTDITNVDLQTGATSGAGSSEALGNGWYRVTQTNTLDGSGWHSISLQDSFPASRNQHFTGDGIKGVYIWGAQLEEGDELTKYTPSVETFVSRATIGTYVGSDGLIKTTPVNLATYSEEISNRGQWVSSPTGSETANAITAPDGQPTADYIFGSNAAGGNVYKFQAVTGTASSSLTFSVHAKKADTDWVYLRTYGFDTTANSEVWFDIANGVKGSTTGATPVDYSITPLPNGWYRCSLTVTLGTDATGNVQMRVVGSDGVTTYGAGTTVGAYLWGAQAEEGTTATPYIKTGNTISGAARYENGELLLEPARTNFVYPSIVPSSNSTVWRIDGAAVTTNAGTAPDGTNTASLVEQASGTGANRAYFFTGGIVRDEAYSFFVKASSPDAVFAFIFVGGHAPVGQVKYTFSTGTVSGSFPGDVSVEPYPNGWVRLSTTSYVGTTSLTTSYVMVQGFTGDFFIWGVQREAGTFPTSYIPTSGSTVTRAADVSTSALGVDSWYNDLATTLYIESPDFPNYTNKPNSGFVYISDENLNGISVGDGIKFGTSSGPLSSRVIVTEGGASQASPFASQGSKFAIAVSENDFNYTIDGTSVGTDNTVVMPTGMDRLGITGYGPGLAHLSRLTYFPTRKTDQELIKITDGTIDPAIITYGITSPGGTFNLRSTGTVDYAVDWDSTRGYETSTSNTLAHTYTAGNYDLVVYSDSVYRPYFSGGSADATQITSIVIGSGADLGTNLLNAWYGALYMTSFVCPFDATSGVTDFGVAWRSCSSLTSFPLIDTSSGVSFNATWYTCANLTSFPLLDVSNGTNFSGAWRSCYSLTSFPLLDVSSAITFSNCWRSCNNLVDFPANMFDTTGTLVSGAFANTFNSCALTAQSIENILVSLDTNGATGITLSINGGTNAAKTTWSAAAVTAYDNLVVKGWTISFNA